MLYEQEMREMALDMGVIALKALHAVDVASAPLGLFSTVYRLVRGPRVALSEMLGSRVLSTDQRRELNRLVASSVVDRGGKKVLLHGDLHASHLIVDIEKRSLGFIDLEAMRIGKAATSFAQLWIGYHFADSLLGQRFYQQYAAQCSDLLDEQFDTDVRTEIALRSYSLMQVGKRSGNQEMEGKARILLAGVLSGASFEGMCLGGVPHGNTESIP